MTKAFLLLMAVCDLVSTLSVRAQMPMPMSHQAWSTDEGLPASGVHAILQSRDGYIWLATEAGAVRFDGYAFTTFREGMQPGFAGTDVSAMVEDAAGNLWFGTSEGVTELRGGAFHRMTAKEGFASGAVLALSAPHDGSVLALTSDGLWRFEGSRFRALPNAPTGISGMWSAPGGDVWLLTEGFAVRYGSDNTRRLPATGPLLGVAEGSGNVVWTWTAREIAEALPRTGRTFRTGVDLPIGRVSVVELDRLGYAWIGTSHGFFVVAPGKGRTPVAVDALRGEAIACLFHDREGNLWVGTESSGLHILRPRTFRNEPSTAGEAVTAVVTASDGTVWFGTRADGVHSVSKTGAQTPVAAASLTSPIVLSLAKGARGDIWAGTPDGLNHISGNHVQRITAATGLPDDFVRSVLVDQRGVVWAGTRRGLARIDGGEVSTLTTADGLGSDSIGPLLEIPQTAASQSEAGLWVGTSAGLSHVRGGWIESFTRASRDSPMIVTALENDGQVGLWVATHGGGLNHFLHGKFQRVRSALLPDEIGAIVLDRKGFLWFRGTHAVYRASQSALLHCAAAADAVCDAHVTTYNTVDGMPSDTLAGEGWPLSWRAEDGELWFATRTGLAATDTFSVRTKVGPPPVAVEHFRVDEKDVALGVAPTRIAPGSNRYVFDFVALSYTVPSKNRFRYMLDGFDREWIEAGAGRTASYTNLPPRHYVFRVQAADNEGVWNREGASVSFEVLPPFYRRWWFYLLAVLLLGALAFAIYRLRVLSIERRFTLVLNERNRVAREVHDTLAQDFVSVSLQLDLASAFLKAKQIEAAQTQLQDTRKLVKNGLEEARQSIWNLRANTAADSLPARLTELARRYEKSNFKMRLKMGGAYHRVPAQIEGEVFRIAQESLSNVERHANAAEAGVELHYGTNELRLTVRDNGQGFLVETAKELQGHYGVRGMRERAATMNGTFTIQSEPGHGTTVTLLVFLPEREGAKT